MWQLSQALAAMNEGCVYDKTPEGAGLTVIVKGVPRALLGGAVLTLPDEEFVCADDDICYLYFDVNEVVEQNSGAWPGGDHIKLAVVTTVGGSITSIVSALKENWDPAGTSLWYNVAAGAAVDMAGEDLEDVGMLDFNDPTNLTIAAGSVTPTQSFHTLTGQGGVFDDLDTIVPDAAKIGQIVIFRCLNIITFIDGADNIECPITGVDIVAADNAGIVAFIQHTATNWVVLFDSQNYVTGLLSDLNVLGNRLESIGEFNLVQPAGVTTINAGVIAYNNAMMEIAAQAGAEDDLDTCTGTIKGDVLILAPDVGDTINVIHGGGADEFYLQNGIDFVMDTVDHRLFLIHNGTHWVELTRLPITARSLVTTAVEDRCIPYNPGTFREAGALAVQVYEKEIYCPVAFTIHNITGRVTAAGVPVGVPCIIDMQVDGLSIFAAQNEMINIAAAAREDTSNVKDHAVAAGSYITIECEQTGAALDLTVIINGYVGITAKP